MKTGSRKRFWLLICGLGLMAAALLLLPIPSSPSADGFPLPSRAAALTPAGGQVPVALMVPPKAYRVGFQVACGGAGDCATIYYSSKTVRVREVWIAKPSSAITVSLNLHSTADTGGTSTNPAGVSMDSSDAAATAVVTAYTAAPTAGTSLGTIAMLPMATTDTWVQDFGALSDKVLALQSAGQGLAIYVSAAATITVNLEWSE